MLWLALALVTEAATFMRWMKVELSGSASTLTGHVPVLSDHTPPLLLRAVDRGYSMHEVAGLGLALTAITIAALLFGVVACGLRRWYCWVFAGVVQLFGVAIATIGLLVAAAAQSATGWLTPADWEPYAPRVAVGFASLVYLSGGVLFVALSVCSE